MQPTKTDHWSRYPRLETLNLLHQLGEDEKLGTVFSTTRRNYPSRYISAEEWLHALSRISEEGGDEMGLYGRKKVLRYDSKVLITPVSDRIYGDRDCYRVRVWTEHTGHRSTVVAREEVVDLLEKMVVNLYRATDARRKYRLFRASRDEAFADALGL